MKIVFSLNAGRCTLSIQGVTAPLRDEQDVQIAWKVVKLALFAKHPQYEIVQLLKTV